jgi:S-adenosyl methyltransferase
MTDYSREAPRDLLQAFNPTVPNVARIYDFLLGGKDNYAADRDAAGRLLDAVPGAAAAAQDNRRFLGRAVWFLAREAGIRQFLDIGTGTWASYCIPFKRLCEHGGAFAAGLFGFGREGYGPAAGGSAAGGQVPGFDPCVHGGAGYADAVGYLPGGELPVGERGGGDVVVVAEVGG